MSFWQIEVWVLFCQLIFLFNKKRRNFHNFAIFSIIAKEFMECDLFLWPFLISLIDFSQQSSSTNQFHYEKKPKRTFSTILLQLWIQHRSANAFIDVHLDFLASFAASFASTFAASLAASLIITKLSEKPKKPKKQLNISTKFHRINLLSIWAKETNYI